MRFFSTREKSPALLISEAIALGLASDGGLYVPDQFPRFQVEDFDGVTEFPEFAFLVLKPFFTEDPLSGELEKICKKAFSFPIVLKDIRSSRSGSTTSVLELFHGPTAAFKDVGARFLAECLSARGQSKQTILVATSGDTGGAVASAFHGRPGFEVVIVFPKDGVSERQRKQLTCWGDNIHSYAVNGNFDTCQKLVKSAFSDPALRGTGKMSSANSINIGRLLPQVTYYALASIQYLRKHRSSASFIIPTGNAGNAVAALWAKEMGFPIGSIGMATNANRVIPDYFKSGDWKPLASIATLANAMDVGNASNMERAFHLEAQGFHLKENVFSVAVSDEEIRKTIAAGEKEYGEVWCPHTATAVHVRSLQRGPSQDWVVVATAHPAKFETIVEPLIGHRIEVPKVIQDLLMLKSNCEEITGDYEDFKARL
jgi:threonine synthase